MKRKIFWIDLFSGAGGTTTGIHLAGMPNVKVVACVNHDKNAIASHKENHPDCMHLIEDVRAWHAVVKLRNLVKQLRKEHPGCLINLWASLECTNFSKAKGGMPREADSRTLAHALYMYIEQLNPDYLYIENVREFMAWGPLDKNGKPVSRRKGSDYLDWRNTVCNYGYTYDSRLLNAADFGAYTSRERYFAIFAKKGMPTVWPEATHSKNPEKNSLFKPLKKWKAVKDVLDLEDEGDSIFSRKKPLVDATLERIYAGLIKFVAGGEKEFMVKYNSMNQSGRYKAPDIKQPCPVVSTQNRLAIANCNFVQKHFSGNPKGKVTSINNPAGTITCRANQSIVSANFLTSYYGNGGAHSANNPCPTLTTKDRFTAVAPQFLVDYQYKSNAHSINKPAPTVLTKDKHAITSPLFMVHNYTSGGQTSSVENPSPTITSVPKQNVAFIDQQYGNSKPASINNPAGSVTANPKFALVKTAKWLLNPQFKSAGSSIHKPCFTLIARMDKRPPSVIEVVQGNFAVIIHKNDTPAMVKIKEFMVLYGIIDIKMRMLKIIELLKIQGFPEDYVLKGTKADQKKFIGNAVETTIAKKLALANAETLFTEIHQTA